MNYSNLEKYLGRTKKTVDTALMKYLSGNGAYSGMIYKVLRYATFPGGKRIRPVLVIAAAEMCGSAYHKVLPTACAMELIHNYSLIHDDLPAMDNDDYRRGKLTVHKKYGECMAILAGDALLTKSFELIAENAGIKGIKPIDVVNVIKLIAEYSGINGMVGGQVLDTIGMKGCNLADINIKEFVKEVHLKKTAALITASVVAGAVLSGVDGDKLNRIRKYGENTGLAFQIVDDVFDNDINRLTYPGIYGIEKSKSMAGDLIKEAKQNISVFGKKAETLNQLADYIIYRKS